MYICHKKKKQSRHVHTCLTTPSSSPSSAKTSSDTPAAENKPDTYPSRVASGDEGLCVEPAIGGGMLGAGLGGASVRGLNDEANRERTKKANTSAKFLRRLIDTGSVTFRGEQ